MKRKMILPKQSPSEFGTEKVGGLEGNAGATESTTILAEAVPPRGWDAWVGPTLLGGGILLVVLAAGLVLRRSIRSS